MNVTTISPKCLAELCRSGKIDLIDVRTPVEFREVHVERARNVPLDRLNPVAVIEGRNGRRDEPLYVICRSGSRGRQACEMFLAAGFANVVGVEGGTLACAEAGVPVVRGWLVHPAFLGLSALIAAGLVFAGITDTCGMGMLLARMPWNQVKDNPSGCCATKELHP
jgi:rhodanese-related sulfurtransferase